MILVTYRCRHSLTGIGQTLIADDADLADFARWHGEVIGTEPYNRDACPVLTPAVVQACMGSSPSL